jgi:hypothetical protein
MMRLVSRAKPVGLMAVCLIGLLCASPMAAPAAAQDATPEAGESLTVLRYWDMGLSLIYPASWSAPQFSAGQALLHPEGAIAPDGTLRGPAIALRIIDPVRDLDLPRDAPFAQIAIAVNVAPGETVAVPDIGNTLFAGLDAGYADIIDGVHGVAGQTVAFMLPDGRIGALVGAAPLDEWGEFAPTFGAILDSATLLRATALLPLATPEYGITMTFAPGGIQFALPSEWVELVLDTSARLYHDRAITRYADDSGFANGPQLVILASPLLESERTTPAAALERIIGARPGDRVAEVMAGGRPAAMRQSIDSATWQIITFVGIPSPDGRVLNVLRWTAPLMLTEAVQPVLDSLLASVSPAETGSR